jgi:hypothetical protein
MKRVVKHELIEVIVPAGATATRFNLPDAQNLRNVQTWGIQIYYDLLVPFSIINGNPTITKADSLLSFLTLENYAGRQFDKQSPINKYQTIENNLSEVALIPSTIQEKDFKSFVGQKINFPKSYIDTVTPIANPAGGLNKVFLISVYYTDKNEDFSQTSFSNMK